MGTTTALRTSTGSTGSAGSAGLADGLSLPELEDALTTLAGHLNAATGQFLVLLGEFDARLGWAVQGITSCAHWLSWRCSLGTGAAREHVRVARALRELPRTTEAFTAGRLSFSKVRALTRLATPDREQALLELALVTPAGPLERYLRGLAGSLDADDETRRHANRKVSWRWAEDGSLQLSARLSPEDGALVVEALESTRDRLVAEQAGARPLTELPDPDSGPHQDAQDVPAGTLRGRSLADALVTICAEADQGSSDSPDQVPNPTRRPELVVHVALADLTDQPDPALPNPAPAPAPESTGRPPRAPSPATAPAPEATSPARPAAPMVNPLFGATSPDISTPGASTPWPRIEGGPGLLRETARRLACDARIVVSIDGPTGATLDVGRAQRFPTAALTRALWQRDGGCAYPGCHRRRHLQAHHLIHWADGGLTCLVNLILLCGTHHRAVHEGLYQVERTTTGEIEFTSPTGTVITPAPPQRGTPDGATTAHDAPIDPWSATPQWYGDHLDLSHAVQATRSHWTLREQATADPTNDNPPPRNPPPGTHPESPSWGQILAS